MIKIKDRKQVDANTKYHIYNCPKKKCADCDALEKVSDKTYNERMNRI